jgi:hypothetical protein
MVGSFLSEDEFGNAHNPVTGEPISAVDAKIDRMTAIGGLLLPEAEAGVVMRAFDS